MRKSVFQLQEFLPVPRLADPTQGVLIKARDGDPTLNAAIQFSLSRGEFFCLIATCQAVVKCG